MTLHSMSYTQENGIVLAFTSGTVSVSPAQLSSLLHTHGPSGVGDAVQSLINVPGIIVRYNASTNAFEVAFDATPPETTAGSVR